MNKDKPVKRIYKVNMKGIELKRMVVQNVKWTLELNTTDNEHERKLFRKNISKNQGNIHRTPSGTSTKMQDFNKIAYHIGL